MLKMDYLTWSRKEKDIVRYIPNDTKDVIDWIGVHNSYLKSPHLLWQKQFRGFFLNFNILSGIFSKRDYAILSGVSGFFSLTCICIDLMLEYVSVVHCKTMFLCSLAYVFIQQTDIWNLWFGLLCANCHEHFVEVRVGHWLLFL